MDSPTQDPPGRGTVWGMAATLSDLLDAQGGVVTTAQLDELAADRAHRRSLQRSLRRVLHGAYARREDDRALLSAYAAVLVVPEVVLRGRSALQVLEVDVLRRPARLEVYVPPTADASDRPELAVRRTTLEAPEQLRVAGLPITSPARTAVDLARDLPPADGLAVLDAVLHAALCGRDDLVAALIPGAGAYDGRGRSSPWRATWRSRRRRAGCGGGCSRPGCRRPYPSTRSGTVTASYWRGWTWPIPRCGSRSSTTEWSSTPTRGHWPVTGSG